MRKFKIVICYFDTSVINRLLDDQSGLDLIKKLRKSLKIYLSVFTFAEIMATSQHERRLKLLMLAKDINENYRPLAMPGDLLKRSLKAIQTDAKDLNILMGPEWDGVWVALRDPQLIDEESLLESIQWKRQQEKWYQDMHDGGRLDIQKALIALSQAERMRI
ncbi:MAG: hypothetical protein NT096_12170, partial [Proteobacteria bacterium]|nr:hypothetical protein [Pseudomonadota bacterium]